MALKVLPDSFANDPDRLARFEREAQVLASLNHPHIAQIYGLEESNPSTGSGQARRALVMELVEGPTLADRIAKGSIPLDEALPMARQIAEALDAAHEQGIIHRDLKPANIKVRADGTVKVLDFGLAKALESRADLMRSASGAGPEGPAYTGSPTLTSPALFIRQGTLVARRLDLARRALSGELVSVAAAVSFDGGIDVGALSASATGLVAYRSGGANRHQLIWFDRTGKALGTLGASDENGLNSPRLSPDGRRVAVWRTVEGNSDIWLLDTLRAARFTSDASVDRYPLFSPDGSTVVFDSNRKGHRDLYRKSSSGVGSEELLLESPQDKSANGWSPDGRFLLYAAIDDPKAGWDQWVLPLGGDRKPFVFLKTSFDERRAQFSLDGRWVAYVSNESGQYEVYVRPFPGSDGASGPTVQETGGGQWSISTAGGLDPHWSPDGKELYYIAPDAKLMAVPVAAHGPTLEVGAPVALFQTRIYGGGTDVNVSTQYDVARDGRFLINVLSDESTASPITLILNWPGVPGK